MWLCVLYIYICVCVCARARVCVCVCECLCLFVCVCADVSVVDWIGWGRRIHRGMPQWMYEINKEKGGWEMDWEVDGWVSWFMSNASMLGWVFYQGVLFMCLYYSCVYYVCVYTCIWVHSGPVVSWLDCQSRGSGFKSGPGKKLGWDFCYISTLLANSAIISTLYTVSGKMRGLGRGLATHPRMLKLRNYVTNISCPWLPQD